MKGKCFFELRYASLGTMSFVKNFDFQFDLPNSDDSDDDLENGLSEAEVRGLTEGLNRVLFDFIMFFLESFSLKRSQESLEVTVQHLVDLTHMETRECHYSVSGTRSR